ncbi:hypothetical protein BRETT_004666 [Brettanomyces bruxellensis]|mgnify:CR=1 FL=1|uniref:Uncharacterized protein n=1 Tax=Dekkera bruxellensis TaxID=5007 RepID=A0A871R8D1_DEKBR|nr:uncharacterized protein BRETT_004666 [Brettanomyces bruxellensis]QOU20018.1 hypothetical protein BRETT_004666 [Brettanomyces bruxellensis]
MEKSDSKGTVNGRGNNKSQSKSEKTVTSDDGSSLNGLNNGKALNNSSKKSRLESVEEEPENNADFTGSDEFMDPNVEKIPTHTRRKTNFSDRKPKLARSIMNSEGDRNANDYDESVFSSNSSDGYYDESVTQRPVILRSNNFRSLTKNISDELNRNFDALPSLQEIQTASEVKPLAKPRFIRARGVVNIEEAPYSRRYLVLLQIMFGSILGVMSRVAMITLTNYQGAYINYHPGTCLWCNFASCFVLGLCNNFFTFWSNALRNSGKRNMKQLALHTGITFGFCGAFSTWGALLSEVDFKTIDIVNGGTKLPARGYGALEFFSVFFVQMSICVTGYVLGKDLAALLDIWWVTKRALRHWNYENLRRVEITFALFGTIGIIANIVVVCTLPMSNWYKRKYAITVLFGIPAGLLRFFFSSYNGVLRWKWFPAGTLISNVCSSTIMAVLNILIYGYKDEKTLEMIISDGPKKYILKSLILGFCGCLSSIASVINELYSLEHPVQRYVYFGATFLFCWIPIFVMDCVYAWVRGFNPS